VAGLGLGRGLRLGDGGRLGVGTGLGHGGLENDLGVDGRNVADAAVEVVALGAGAVDDLGLRGRRHQLGEGVAQERGQRGLEGVPRAPTLVGLRLERERGDGVEELDEPHLDALPRQEVAQDLHGGRGVAQDPGNLGGGGLLHLGVEGGQDQGVDVVAVGAVLGAQKLERELLVLVHRELPHERSAPEHVTQHLGEHGRNAVGQPREAPRVGIREHELDRHSRPVDLGQEHVALVDEVGHEGLDGVEEVAVVVLEGGDELADGLGDGGADLQALGLEAADAHDLGVAVHLEHPRKVGLGEALGQQRELPLDGADAGGRPHTEAADLDQEA